MADQTQAVARMTSYPLINDSWAKLSKVYQETKDKNAIIRLGCNVAESSVLAAVHVAKPVLKRLDTPAAAMNSLACQQLDKLENAFPIITKPTDVVLDETKALMAKAVQPAVDNVKGRVVAAMEMEERLVNGFKSYANNAVISAKNYGVAGINQLVGAVRLGMVLDVTEQAVDRYLPDDDASSQCQNKQPTKALDRINVVAVKVKQRAYKRAMQRLNSLQKRSTETVQKLKFTVDLIEYAKVNLDATAERVQSTTNEVSSKMRDMYEQIVAVDGAEQGHVTDEKASSSIVEQRVIQVARALTIRTRVTLRRVSALAYMLPLTAAQQLKAMEQHAEALYASLAKATSFEDISASLLSMIKEKTDQILEFSSHLSNVVVSQAAKYVDIDKAFSWMGVGRATNPQALSMSDVPEVLHDEDADDDYADSEDSSSPQDQQ